MTNSFLTLLFALTPVQLQFERAAEAARCLDEATLRSLVRERLGVDPFQPEAKQHITVNLHADARGFEAELRLASRDGEPPLVRTLRSAKEDCSDL